jgi:hypothetical protein
MTEQCAGLSASMSDVTWYLVPGVRLFSVEGAYAQGEWLRSGNRIVLGDSASRDGSVVRHEMLHALLGRVSHDRGYFLGRCAGVVACPPQCIGDAGPAHIQPAQVVPPESLEITVTVDPVKPTAAIDNGYFSVSVTARNGSAHPVMIAASTAYGGPALTFRYVLSGPKGGIGDDKTALDSSMVYFAAFETKRQVFDFVIGSDIAARELPPGSYFLRAGYGSHTITIDSLSIGP